MLKTKLVFSTGALLITSLFSSSTIACDTKTCEAAYLKTTERYAYLQRVHAEMYRAERLAYAKIRENRDYALHSHIRQLKPAFKK